MESLNVKNINDEKIFNVIDPNGQGEVVNRIRPISVSINQKAQTINEQTDSTINLAVYWNDTWKSILDLTFDESLRQEYGKLTQDLTNIQKDIDMKQYKDAETKTADFLKYVTNLSNKYTSIPEKAVVSKIKNGFVKIKADKNSVKATISDKLLNFMLKKYAKVDTLDYTKANECFSTSKFNFLANNYDFYYHSPEIFQKQAYMTVVKDNKVVGSYKVNYDQFSKFASKFMLTPQKLGYSKDRLAGYMKTAEVVMQNIFFDSVDEAKEWQEMVDEKKKEQATTPEGEEETTETTTTETKTEIGEGKSESPVKGDGGLARPSEDFASDEIPESEPKQQEQQGGGQNLGASRRLNLLKKKASYTDKEISNIGYEQGAKDGTKAKGIKETQETINKNLNQLKEKYGKDKNGMGSFILKEWNSFVAGYTNGFSDGVTGNVEKKAKVGYNAKPENREEEIAIDLAEDFDSAASMALDKAGLLFGGYSGEEERKERVEIAKKAIEPMISDNFKRKLNPKIYNLMIEHLTDINSHIVVSAIEEVMGRKQASKKVKLNKKAENRKNYNVVIGFDGKEEESDFAQEDVISALQEALIYFGEKWHELPSSLDNIDKLDFVKIREIEKGETVKEYTKEDILKMKEDFPKYACKKQALYGDVQEQDIVPAKTETKVYLQSDINKIINMPIRIADVVAIYPDNIATEEEAAKYSEFIGKPMLLMETDKEDVNNVILEEIEYPFQRITVNGNLVGLYDAIKGADVVVEDIDGDEMITTFEELPIVAKQCKIKSIHKAANISKKKANLKAINSLEDVAGLLDTIWSDYDWYDYSDALEIGEQSHYENLLADVQKDEKGAIEGVLNYVAEYDGYTSPEIEQLKEYYNAKFGGK